MSQFVNYEEMAQRHNAAYAAFKSIFESKNPPPQRKKIARDLVSLVIILALVIVMVASVYVSASRTVAEFGADDVGKAAFIMLEGGIMAYSFFRARRNSSASKFEDARQLATYGLGLAFFVAVGANIDTSLKNHNVFMPEAVKTIINLLVAVSAPVLAFISADVLALELMAGDARRRQADLEFDQRLQEWTDKLNNAWNSNKSNWGVEIRVSSPILSNGIPLENPLEENRPALPAASTLGHSKAPDASKKVREYFQENPEAINDNPVEVAAMLNVGKSTVYNILKEHKHAANGRAREE